MRKQFYVIDWRTGLTMIEFYSVWNSGDEVEYCEQMNFYFRNLIGLVGEFERFYYIS